MAKDKYEILGPMFADIGAELAEIVGGNPNGTFLYVEIGEGWVRPSVYKDEGSVVRDFEIGESRLCDLIFDAWYAEDTDKRWAVMEYEIEGGKFDVRFKFPDEVDVLRDIHDRREVMLKARYGDKPVIYPPIPDDFSELKE
ncbi:hypothetical protein LZK98_19065 [Sphingomonas cannabina]|uniref:hypothetical protein n=1 Tax=Sphingomonas cannabina TaxID=2899123 RepID=UPI001F23858E|nr:hypothetical protein [Sphingomonas cannabina]UIJ45119.1 hypothetical protein LZK98_19065 [Sphingomonas cannabina]